LPFAALPFAAFPFTALPGAGLLLAVGLDELEPPEAASAAVPAPSTVAAATPAITTFFTMDPYSLARFFEDPRSRNWVCVRARKCQGSVRARWHRSRRSAINGKS